MILKYFETNKINFNKSNFLLFHGKNDGYKREEITKISEKLRALSKNLFGEEISSKQNLIEKIKKEDFNKDSIEEFLFELSCEKLSIDNPSYLKD